MAKTSKSINQPQGPTVGNINGGNKGSDLIARREQGRGIADAFMKVFAARTSPAKVDPRLQGVAQTVKPQKLKK